MRSFAVPLLAASLTFSIVACGDDDDSSEDTATESSAAADVSDVPDIVGESVDDATATLEEAGMTLRVLKRDGEDLAGTMDFVDNRVNVAVETQDDGTEVVTEIISVG